MVNYSGCSTQVFDKVKKYGGTALLAFSAIFVTKYARNVKACQVVYAILLKTRI